MTAREKFQISQQVLATAKFFAKHRRYREHKIVLGIVRGFSVTGQGVRVQIVGEHPVYRYPMNMWETVAESLRRPAEGRRRD